MSRAKKFAEVMVEWDKYKEWLNQQLQQGKITEERYNELLVEKAAELDL